jgi:hypothetical protein
VLFTGLLPMLGSCGSVTGAEEPLPSIPVVRATPASNTEVMLMWPRIGLSTTGGEIRVERGVDEGAYSEIAVLAGDAGEYLDVGLNPSTRYRYRVRACSAVGCSAFVMAHATTLGQGPE